MRLAWLGQLLAACVTLTAFAGSPESAGRTMYRAGLLPSGKPMSVAGQGGASLPGTAFACAGCHQRSGMGAVDEGFVTPAASAGKLFQPLYRKWPRIPPALRAQYGLSDPPSRPAYTDATLAKTIRTGVDPTGRVLHAAMPRYLLQDRDMRALIGYLRGLSAELSPGVTETTLAFATVITEEVSAKDREAMLVPLDNFIQAHNRMGANFDDKMYTYPAGVEMKLSYRRLSLARWVLSGPQATWAAQLQEHYRREPVFALLGGISYGDWRPVHAFCESLELPCLFPITDLPVVSDRDWYTLYFSKGLFLEGAAAAHHLAGTPAGRLLQVVRDNPQGRALARGFQETWAGLGLRPPRTVLLPAGAALPASLLRTPVQGAPPAAVVLWAGAEAFPALRETAGPEGPALVLVSSTYLKQDLWELPEEARAAVRVTYPYRRPEEEAAFSRYANSLLAGITDPDAGTRISTRMYSLTQVLNKSFMDLDKNFYRDNLLDVIGMLPDLALPDYRRLSFGGRRYASDGCSVLALGPGRTFIAAPGSGTASASPEPRRAATGP